MFIRIALILLLSQNQGYHLFIPYDTFDYGKIRNGKLYEHIFEVKNDGSKPIIIFDVKPVCGCTIAEFPKIPIQKGRSGFIKVIFHAVHQGGFNKAIVVNTNAKIPTYFLTIKGSVY